MGWTWKMVLCMHVMDMTDGSAYRRCCGGSKGVEGGYTRQLVSTISRATRATRIAFTSQRWRNGKNENTCNTTL